MKFSIQNLGRLAEATIDLDKDLILFVGPNNTSKTYVAHTLYGFYSRLENYFVNSIIELLTVAASFSEDGRAAHLDLTTFWAHNRTPLLRHITDQCAKDLPDILATTEAFTSATELSLSSTINTDDLSRAVETDKVLAHPSANHRVWIRTTEDGRRLHVETLSVEGEPDDGGPRDALIKVVMASFLTGIATHRFFQTSARTRVLTAERAAIQLFSRELSANRSELIERMLKLTARGPKRAAEALSALQQGARRYPAAIQDSLILANDLAAQRKETSQFAPLADRLEREFLGGKLHVSDDGDLLFQPGPDAPHLPLHLASSSVKALSGLVFHMRHLLAEGDVLIIDEPELNLHPDNQRRVARAIARLVRGGVKVILSTHSDYVIREFNNLIMLSADEAEDLRRRHGYDAEETLRPDRIGAYLFSQTQATALEVAPTGIEVESIDREINALNTVAQDIYFSLFGKD